MEIGASVSKNLFLPTAHHTT